MEQNQILEGNRFIAEFMNVKTVNNTCELCGKDVTAEWLCTGNELGFTRSHALGGIVITLLYNSKIKEYKSDLISLAIKRTSIDLLQILYTLYNQKISKKNLFESIKYDCIQDTYVFLQDNFKDLTDKLLKNLLRNAIIYDRYSIVKIIVKKMNNIPKYFLFLALKHKNLKIIEFIKSSL